MRTFLLLALSMIAFLVPARATSNYDYGADEYVVASGIVLPKRVDKFYPKRPFQNGIVLPIVDNQGITRLLLMGLG
jgi:hypothetical protein